MIISDKSNTQVVINILVISFSTSTMIYSMCLEVAGKAMVALIVIVIFF